MSSRSLFCAIVLVIGLAFPSGASLITFNSNNGGFSADTLLMNSGGNGTPWTYTLGSDCWGGQGCWLVLDYGNVSLQALSSPLYFATGPVALAFDETFNEEAASVGYDGGVVEISVNHGAFTDVVSAYGAFSGQSYTKTVSTGWGNPLAGRQSFSGMNPGGFGTFVSSSMTLPLSNGDSFQLRWVQGTDSASTAFGANGWILDNVSLDFGNAPAQSVPEPGSFVVAAAGIAVILVRRSLYS